MVRVKVSSAQWFWEAPLSAWFLTRAVTVTSVVLACAAGMETTPTSVTALATRRAILRNIPGSSHGSLGLGAAASATAFVGTDRDQTTLPASATITGAGTSVMVASAVTGHLQSSHTNVRSDDLNRMQPRADMHPSQLHRHLELASRPPHWHQSEATI